MDVPEVREAVSSAIHAAALLASLPALALLLRKGRGDGRRQASLAIFGVGLVCCLGASATSHFLAAIGRRSAAMNKVDHMAIYLLIAGTYTPIASSLLPLRDRLPTLRAIWFAAIAGMTIDLLIGPLPPVVATSFYLGMGWGGLWCYGRLRPSWTHRRLALIPLGGVFYSVGAACHVLRAPVVWPGVIGGHEVFHVLVVLGASMHLMFLWKYVAAAPVPSPDREQAAPRMARRGVAIPGPSPPSGARRRATKAKGR